MYLSKAFDTINHNLLVAKLHAYGFSNDSLKLRYSYLNNRCYRTKISHKFSSWKKLSQEIPEVSALGPLLFSIYLSELSGFTSLCNFIDDTTFYACGMDLNSLIKRLEHDSFLAIEWFKNNNMKSNQDKCHLLVSGYKNENVLANIGNEKIWDSNKRKLLGLDIDRNLNFNEHASSLCRKAGNKLSVLAWLSNFMSFKQRRILLKTFMESQFGYCPLIWMFHSRRVNDKINHLNERSLCIVYKDNYSSYVDFLAKDKSFTIHHRNIQPLDIELFKVKRNFSNVIMYNILKTRTLTYNLRSQTDSLRDCVKTRHFGLNSLGYFAPKVRDTILLEIKNINSLLKFKTEIRKGAPENWSYYLCRQYIQNCIRNTCRFVELVETFDLLM